MARATFVQKARKDIPDAGIKAGESYYWWKFRFGGKRYSKVAPKRSQLTQSSFYATIYDIEDEVIGKAEANDGLESVRDDVVSQLEDLKSECESNLENIPENLKEGSSGQLLHERIDALDNAIQEFEGLEFPDFEPENGSVVLSEQINEDGDCVKCGEHDRHTLECELSVKDEEVNDDEQTEEEYWQSKLDDLQNVSIDAP